MSIAAVVVTYNRKEELAKNVQAVLAQTLPVDTYYIIDNHGTDDTEEYLNELGLTNRAEVEYLYLPTNTGGAGGFSIGLQKAYEAGHDYICLMDDDGRPADENMMSRLLHKAEQLHDTNPMVMVNALVLDDSGQNLSFGLTGIHSPKEAIEQAKDNVIFGTINPFNATLLSRELVETIGFVNKEFFIKGDEEDYQMRAEKAGAVIATVTDAHYYHPRMEKRELKLFGRSYFEVTEAPWKEYYRARNLTFLFRREGMNERWMRHILRQILLALRYNNRKMKAVRMIVRGCFDGLRGKLGKTVQP